jgi:hypothetical protein
VSGYQEGSPDRVLLAEVLATIEAAADMCVAASSPSTSLDEALALPRTVRVQLDCAARLMVAMRPPGGKIRTTAAAGRGFLPVDPAAAVATSREDTDGGLRFAGSP